MSRHAELMARRAAILNAAGGVDYERFRRGTIAFDWDALIEATAGSYHEVAAVQEGAGVGNTPLLPLEHLTEVVRRHSPRGKGAMILVKDESTNPSGSFKDRRAALSAHHAKRLGFAGLVAATSGNYGAAVASQAARRGLRAIVVQETFDSAGRGQPEILEKGRKCEAFGAEVIQTSVGPELFYLLLRTLEETGYFNASLYTPFGVAGIETLGRELVEQVRDLYGRDPDVVLATHAGGGLVTGTGMGLRNAAAHATELVGVSVDLRGLHMASDHDFNRKSFTTGHTGFAIPFTTWPDRVDVPINAARPLRFMDRMLRVSQGSVFFATELLARLEGLERGPAGNTSLAAAVVVAAQRNRDEIVVVNETEYTGAGKSPTAQLAFAEQMGVEVRSGAEGDQPGKVIAIPTRLDDIAVSEVDLAAVRRGYLRRALSHTDAARLRTADWEFLGTETRLPVDTVQRIVTEEFR